MYNCINQKKFTTEAARIVNPKTAVVNRQKTFFLARSKHQSV